jgi:hypothetical protein
MLVLAQGNRTLNLGIKTLSTQRLREDQGGSERLNRTRIHDATVSESLLESQGVSRSRCQIGCEIGALLECQSRASGDCLSQFGLGSAVARRVEIKTKRRLLDDLDDFPAPPRLILPC